MFNTLFNTEKFSNLSPDKQIEQKKIDLRVHGTVFLIYSIILLILLQTPYLFTRIKKLINLGTGNDGENFFNKNFKKLKYVFYGFAIFMAFTGIVLILYSYEGTQNQANIILPSVFYSLGSMCGFFILIYLFYFINENAPGNINILEILKNLTYIKIFVLSFFGVVAFGFIIAGIVLQYSKLDKVNKNSEESEDE